MKKEIKSIAPVLPRQPSSDIAESGFQEVVKLIQAARQRSYSAVNTELIDLYWKIPGIEYRAVKCMEL